MLESSIQRVLIVGPGLLGGSIGLALREAGYEGSIVGFSRTAATVQTAIDRGCIDAGANDMLEAAKQSDLIVLATPVKTLRALIEQLGEVDLRNTVITDVGSTKRSIMGSAQMQLKRPGMFVGSHPMAGSEQHGPAAADAKLFQGKPVVLTPERTTDPHAITVVESLWKTLGMRVFRMTPGEHDHAVARISHLPHAMSVLLMQLASQNQGLEIASTGLRDVTRLAGGNGEMWADIFFDNLGAMSDTLDEFKSLLFKFEKMLESGDRAGLVKLLDDAAKSRTHWLGNKEAH